MNTIFSNETLQSIIYIVLTAILPIVVNYIAKICNAKVAELTANVESEQARKYIDAAVDAISIAVTAVNQTYVDSLKADGKFDEAAATTAKNLALEKAKELISADSKKFIEMMYSDFDKYLENAIEAYVRESKLNA